MRLCVSLTLGTSSFPPKRSADNFESAHRINPSWVTLDTSRGIETETSKVFMRTTVVAWDVLVYVPALVMFVKTWHGNRSGRTQVSTLPPLHHLAGAVTEELVM